MNHLAALANYYDITVMANAADFGFLVPLGSSVHWVPIGIKRKIAPLHDMVCLFRLACAFQSRDFKAVHSVTPKAGLLAMTAAWLMRVPVRIHWFTGQVWATRSGAIRFLLKGLDRLTAALATHLLVDSSSQVDFLASQGVAPREKMRVLAKGSICGVDAGRFRPDGPARAEVRARLGLPQEALVFLFVGRCTFDKGLTDLARAFEALCSERDDVYLVIVGPDEEGVFPAMLRFCPRAVGRVRRLDYTDAPERVMAAADMLCLPSYREGFGSVVIEAAAVGIPSIGSRIYGVTDAIQDGITGLLHQPHDAQDLLEKMRHLVQDPDLRCFMGSRARARAEQEFAQDVVTAALLNYYECVVGLCTGGA
jgi:glycosyltransferase involved in cell wall biosynthesis